MDLAAALAAACERGGGSRGREQPLAAAVLAAIEPAINWDVAGNDNTDGGSARSRTAVDGAVQKLVGEAV